MFTSASKAPNVLGNTKAPMTADICLREPAADFWAHLGEQRKSFPEDATTLSVKPRGHIGGLRVWVETRVKVPGGKARLKVTTASASATKRRLRCKGMALTAK